MKRLKLIAKRPKQHKYPVGGKASTKKCLNMSPSLVDRYIINHKDIMTCLCCYDDVLVKKR